MLPPALQTSDAGAFYTMNTKRFLNEVRSQAAPRRCERAFSRAFFLACILKRYKRTHAPDKHFFTKKLFS